MCAGTPHCGKVLLRYVRCFRRNEPNNDAQPNYSEKLPMLFGKTRWNPSLLSVHVLHPAPHRRSHARSKDPGREDSPLRHRKWLYDTLRICRGSACLRGIPPVGRGFQSAAAQLQWSGLKEPALYRLLRGPPPHPAAARKHHTGQHRQPRKTDPVATPGETSGPPRSRRRN